MHFSFRDLPVLFIKYVYVTRNSLGGILMVQTCQLEGLLLWFSFFYHIALILLLWHNIQDFPIVGRGYGGRGAYWRGLNPTLLEPSPFPLLKFVSAVHIIYQYFIFIWGGIFIESSLYHPLYPLKKLFYIYD